MTDYCALSDKDKPSVKMSENNNDVKPSSKPKQFIRKYFLEGKKFMN